jgi:hypothetical protein
MKTNSEDLASPITIVDWNQHNESNLQTEEQQLLTDLEPETDEKMKMRYMDFVRIMRRNS